MNPSSTTHIDTILHVQGNASRTAVEQWLDVCSIFKSLKVECIISLPVSSSSTHINASPFAFDFQKVLKSLSNEAVKLTAQEHRDQRGARGRIIQQLEAGMKDKVRTVRCELLLGRFPVHRALRM